LTELRRDAIEALPSLEIHRDAVVTITAATFLVRLSSRYAWLAILCFLGLTVLCAGWFVHHFAITTDSSKLLSKDLPWRQQEIKLDRAFPQRTDQIVAVIDASTPEGADEAADALVNELSARHDLIRSVARPDGGEFFARNGILFQTTAEVRRDAADLIAAEPFLGTLAADPTLRGVLRTLSQSIEGVRLGRSKFQDLQVPVTAIADALERLEDGKDPAFSWRKLITGRAPEISDLRRFVNIQPVLDYDDLQPGGKATRAIRNAVAKLGLTPAAGTTVHLTGAVALSDEEFGTIAEGAELNGIVTLLVVVLLLWLALKQLRIVVAVLLTLVVGLVITASAGLWMVGALNLISVAFAVLFVGLGVDFGIQFSVRYRAERLKLPDFHEALLATARLIATPLLLAAASIAAAFYSFLPTAYRGLSELGLIAGTGMMIAYITTVTLLPALLTVLRPHGEKEPIGYAALAPLDSFLERRRNLVVGTTLTATILALPLLAGLRFDFNPLDLRSPSTESVSTVLDLLRDPKTSPNTIDILESDLPKAEEVAANLRRLPEVAQALTLQSFVPGEQEEKLEIIEDANFFLQNTLNPIDVEAPPSQDDTLKSIETTARDLQTMAGEADTPEARQARRLADLLFDLAKSLPDARAKAEAALTKPLMTTLQEVRELLSAEPVSIDTLPADLKRDWIAEDGEARIEVAPNGNGNDNATLHRFVDAVRKIAPEASGSPVFIIEAAATIVRAFLEAGAFSVISIALILYVALRRWTHVALTLVPLLVAVVVTLELCVAIGLEFNFANIIALPLLLGVGVAFKIYYVLAWRNGETNFLQSSLTRAVFFSACATATAFGSLWFSHHPGTSSMGKLMALSLVTTLSAAVIFQPALLATQRKGERKAAE